MHFSGLDRAGTSPVTADNGGGCEFSGGDHFADPPADAGGLNADDLPLLNIIRNQVLGVAKRCRRDGDILQAHLLHQNFGDHAGHIVSLSKFGMKRNGHSVVRAAALACLSDTAAQLAALRLYIPAGFGGISFDIFAVHIIFSLIDLFAVFQEFFGDFPIYCVFHTVSLPPRFVINHLCKRRTLSQERSLFRRLQRKEYPPFSRPRCRLPRRIPPAR